MENIDVFCEKGVFEVEDSKRILEVSLDTEQGYVLCDILTIGQSMHG